MTTSFAGSVGLPDEDVLVGNRFSNDGGYEAFRTLHDIVPGRTTRPRERAGVGPAVCKRFGIERQIRRSGVHRQGDGILPSCSTLEVTQAGQITQGSRPSSRR